MYESLREHFDVVLGVMLAAMLGIHGLVRARFVLMEKKLDAHDKRIGTLETSDARGFENVLAEIRVVKAEIKSEVSGLRAWIAENYTRRGDDFGRGQS